jgi:hypothetical protein
MSLFSVDDEMVERRRKLTADERADESLRTGF